MHIRPVARVPGRLPVEGRLHALRPGDLDPRPRQVDGVHGEGEALARGQRVAELELAGVAGDGLVHQHLVGEAHLDPAGQRGDRRIGAVDAAVAADRLDAVEVVGVGDLGRDHVAERRAVAGDAAVEVAEALQRRLGRRAGGGGRRHRLALRHQPRGRRQQPRALHLPAQLVEDAAGVHREPRHLGHRRLDRHRRQRPAAGAELVRPGTGAGGVGSPKAAFSQKPKASASIGTTTSPSAVTASLTGARGSRP